MMEKIIGKKEKWTNNGTDIYVPAILRSRTSWQLKAMPGTR